jgi:hypothetical protein
MGGATTGQSINLELGVSATALASINSTSFRTLANVASGQISISNFYGKSNVPPYWFATQGGNTTSLYWRPWNMAANSTTTYVTGSNNAQNETIAYSLNTSTGAVNWGRNWASSYGEKKIQIDSAGNQYYLEKSVTPGSLIKLDSSGAVVWVRTITPNVGGSSSGCDLKIDSSDNIYVLITIENGSSYYPCVFKLNTSGTLIWTFKYINNSANVLNAQSMMFDTSNNPVLHTWAQPSPNFFPGIVKIDASTGSPISGFIYSIIGIASASTLVARPGAGYDSSGNYYTCGYAYVGGTVNYRAWVAKHNSSNVLQWIKYTSNNLYLINPTYMTVDGSGNALLWGAISTDGASDTPFVTRFDTSGNVLFQMLFTGLSSSNSRGVLQTSTNVMTLCTAGNTAGMQARLPLDSTASGYYQAGGSPLYVSNLALTWSAANTQSGGTAVIATNGTGGTVTTSSYTVNTLTFSTLTNEALTLGGASASTSFIYPGTFTWIVPSGVTSISAVTVSGGGGGTGGFEGGGGQGGAGGGLAYLNNYSVTAGQSYTVFVGRGGPASTTGEGSYIQSPSSSFICRASRGGIGPSDGGAFQNGTAGATGGGGGGGGAGGGGGGGAAGYSGNGGAGGTNNAASGGSGSGGGGGAGRAGTQSGDNSGGGFVGGGVGLGGQGSNGVGGTTGNGSVGNAGSAGAASKFGGGGYSGGASFIITCCCAYWIVGAGGAGGSGGVRIIWPGSSRTFPSTNTGAP